MNIDCSKEYFKKTQLKKRIKPELENKMRKRAYS